MLRRDRWIFRYSWEALLGTVTGRWNLRGLEEGYKETAWMMVDGKHRPEWHPQGADERYAGEVQAGVSGGHDGFEGSSARADRARRKRARRPNWSAEELVEGIKAGRTAMLARAITLVESNAPRHREMAREILRGCRPLAGNSIRVGITGVPGAGKSTFMERLGKRLCGEGRKLAVLAVDPSSSVRGGSVLGDKTRMEELAREANAFIRPSPSSGALGGVAAKTRESMMLCEAAGYELIFVETVGVGQSEVAVRSMVDFFLLLQIAGAGDELQGIKKGVIEIADAIAVNKADGDNEKRAQSARMDYQRVLHYLQPYTPGWKPQAVCCSAVTGYGIEDLWQMILRFVDEMKASGYFEERRRRQNIQWLRSMLEEAVLQRFYAGESMKRRLAEIEEEVSEGQLPVLEAVERLLAQEP